MTLDASKLTPEQQEAFDLGFGKKAEEFDKLRSDFEKMKKDHSDALKRLTDASNTNKMTATELEDYKKRIDDIENEKLSVTERHQKDLVKSREENEKKLKMAADDALGWRKRFEDREIDSALMSAATTNDAYKADQVMRMLKSSAFLKEEGEGADRNFTVMLRLPDAEGKLVEVPAADGVKGFLKENPNLLRSSIMRGNDGSPEALTLTNPDGSKKVVDFTKMSAAEINKNFDEIQKII